MAPVELNHQEVKQQMIDIIQATSALYDINDETKLTYAEVGEPNGTPPIPPVFPGLWITNNRPLETIIPKGSVAGDSHAFLAHDVDYAIKYLANESDSIKAEKILDEFQKLIMETFEADDSFFHNKWATGQNYIVGTKRSNVGSLFVSKTVHTSSGANEPPNATNWTFLTRLPNTSWPSRVDILRQELDGQPLRGRVITWKCKFTT